MEIKYENLHLTAQLKKWIEEGLDNEAILSHLKNEDYQNTDLNEILHQINKIRNKKRTRTGSILVLIGVIILGIGFISCIILHYLDQDINFSLYGLTCIGAIALIIGLILIFN
jgi:hypothetical protein